MGLGGRDIRWSFGDEPPMLNTIFVAAGIATELSQGEDNVVIVLLAGEDTFDILFDLNKFKSLFSASSEIIHRTIWF